MFAGICANLCAEIQGERSKVIDILSLVLASRASFGHPNPLGFGAPRIIPDLNIQGDLLVCMSGLGIQNFIA